jgi:hypothetical protein
VASPSRLFIYDNERVLAGVVDADLTLDVWTMRRTS